MKIEPLWEGTDFMVKLEECGPGLWVVLLQVSWGWNMSHVSSKTLILCKKIHPLFHLAHPKYPYILLKYLSKMGYMRCDRRGIYLTGTYPWSGNLWKKSGWNNQISMGVLHFYSMVHYIDLIGTCLKILLDPMYVRVETRYPTPRYPIFTCSI